MSRVTHTNEIIDYVHIYIGSSNKSVCKILILISSLYLDVCFVVMCAHTYMTADLRFFELMGLGLTTRFICQLINRVPGPRGMIWVHPGIPSITVSYKIVNDMFFSGHMYASLVYTKLLEGYVGPYAYLGPVYQFVTMGVTQSHYFMDIYAAFMTFQYFSAIVGL